MTLKVWNGTMHAVADRKVAQRMRFARGENHGREQRQSEGEQADVAGHFEHGPGAAHDRGTHRCLPTSQT